MWSCISSLPGQSCWDRGVGEAVGIWEVRTNWEDIREKRPIYRVLKIYGSL